MRLSSALFGFVVLALLAFGTGAQAFPPAPPFTLRGIARDQFGWALKATDQATVVVKRNGVIIGEAAIDERLTASENFKLRLPMDTNPADPYKTGALSTGTLMSIEVRFASGTFPVSSLSTSQRTIGQPGGSLFIDFTIGMDSDGDGIPDAWEWWQLGEAGFGPGDPKWSLGTLGQGDFDGDGTSDYVEYLAGTFSFLTEDSLNLKITGFDTDGSAMLHTLVVIDKTYRVEASSDMKTWTTVPVRAAVPQAAVLATFTAADTHEVTLYSAAAISQSALFYRLVLVR